MKKMILGLSLSTVLVLMSGCGDSSDKVDIDAVTVTYKNAATYDLSEYILATQSQTNNYVSKEFTNTSGKKDYKNTPDEEIYSITRFEVNQSIVKEYNADNFLQTTNTILSDRIKTVDTDSEEILIARFADKDDYIIKSVTTDADNTTTKIACKINKHLNTKAVNNKTYTDILEMSCDVTFSETTTAGGDTVSSTADGIIIIYFAKDNGPISSMIEACTKTSIGDKIVKNSCTKTTEDITNIIH